MNLNNLSEDSYYFLPKNLLDDDEKDKSTFFSKTHFLEEPIIIKSKLSPKAKEFIPFNTNNYK